MSKYRLWDIRTRTMIYSDDSTDCNTLYAIGLNGLAIAINLDPDSDEPVIDWTAGRRMIPLECTGSHDKNGREIYRGDVLRLEGVARGIVESANGSYYVRTNDHSIPLQAIAPEMREIVGNVYENILHLPKRDNTSTATVTACFNADLHDGVMSELAAKAIQHLRDARRQLEEG
jgi:hypothetical protein